MRSLGLRWHAGRDLRGMGMGAGNRAMTNAMKGKAAGAASSTPCMALLLLFILSCTLFLSAKNSEGQDSQPGSSSRRFLGKEQEQGRRVALPAMSAQGLARQQATQVMEREAIQHDGAREPISFMLVTAERPNGCKTMEGSHMLMKSYKNKVDYCNLHRCRVWYSLEVWDEDMPGTWARYKLLKKLMKAFPDIPWFMWMDGDAMFTDMGYDIPFDDYDNKWAGKRMIFHGFETQVYGDNPEWTAVNAGVFLMRNCEWSLNFLDKWIAMGDPSREKEIRAKLNAELPSRPKDWPADDQSALVYLLRQNKILTENNAERDDFHRVYLELRYFLHGYWLKMVDHYDRWQAAGNDPNAEEMDRWPFVTHFVGCKICSGEYASSSATECSKQFDRAYTFADQQLLALAGMEHTALGTQKVQPIHGAI